jgi:hypothetical protein
MYVEKSISTGNGIEPIFFQQKEGCGKKEEPDSNR